MRYCSHCGIEYDEQATCCDTCSASELIDGEELERRRSSARARAHELNDVRLVRVGTAEDPLTAELLSRVLDAACTPVFAKDPRAGVMSIATTGMPHDWWEFWVPETEAERATQILAQAKARLSVTPEEAARAAEEEELESEQAPAPEKDAPVP
ncbi:MAG: DUF2007 domain-containing protein [Myxococcaceae bacterium]|nr:DUF2007 domain-containing protein [Myxococcaceae bacterium]